MRALTAGLIASCLLMVSTLLCAQAPGVSVDPRVELMSILFRLAGNPEYSQGQAPLYNEAIDRHFGQFKDHEAVRLARTLRESDGVSYDAVMSMAVHVKDVETLAEKTPFDLPGQDLERRWHGVKARSFLVAARKFAADTRFTEFIKSQQAFYETINTRLRPVVAFAVDMAWFEKTAGAKANARFYVVPAPANGHNNYSVILRAGDGVEEVYAMLGVWRVDGAGLPTFDAAMVVTLVHEFLHSYASPLISMFWPQLEKAATQIYAPVQTAMQKQAYGEPRIVLEESLVRALTARYNLAHSGRAVADMYVRWEETQSFLWIGELSEMLGSYEQDRQAFPTLEAFMPKIVVWAVEVGPRVEGMVRRAEESRPEIVYMTPANGSRDVDPGLKQIVVHFDRPMRKGGYSVLVLDKERFPKLGQVGFDESGTVFTIEVELAPDHDYEFGLNSQSGGSFASAGGVRLDFVRVEFRTRAAQP